MISLHPSFIQPTNPEIKLWRYMDLSKFVALIQERNLYFARADQLGDVFEGSAPRKNAELAEYIIQHRNTDPTLLAYKDVPEAEIRENSRVISAMRKNMRQEAYVSCWHMNEHESAAMWKLYSQSSDAVCIQTIYSMLASLLPYWIYMGLIEYIDYEGAQISEGNLFNFLLHKRRSFDHEREVRAITCEWLGEAAGGHEVRASLCDGGAKVNIDLHALIEFIFVSPSSPGWFKKIVKGLVKTYQLDVVVKHSNLSDPPLY